MYEIFEELMTKRNLKFAQIARETGVTYSTFTDWKSGRCKPGPEKLQKIAEYFGVTVEYLLGNKSSPLQVTASEREIVLALREADSVTVEMVRRILHLENKKENLGTAQNY